MGSVSIPAQQQAAIRQGSGETATAPLGNIEVPQPGPGQILDFGVAMKSETKGIAGHEGAGNVVALGPGTESRWQIGDRAGVKWIASVCGECEFCLNGVDEVHCIAQMNSGFSVPGTFQQYCLADSRYTSKIPDGVKDEEAGPIMCGGVTAYVACKRSSVKPGQWIVLPGAGGGLGHFAIQYARAMGMRVIAIDGGEAKGKLCKELGAEAFIDFQTTKDIAAEIMKITTYGAHGVIVTAATREAYGSAPSFLRPSGTVVAVGLPKDATVVAGAPPIMLALRRLNVVGSVVGSMKDVEEALDFTARGLVKPILTRGKLADLDQFIDKLVKGQVAGRVVLEVAA
ncbi:Alcohol dehydrogenase GroES-like domain-containing protein [Cladophialophora immunda]|nr:Alcohol dehydrogenase GroES-like domain-containing protein [Cladophialophora immunda]